MGTLYYVFVESTLDYIVRMLPGLLGAAILFFILRPWRRKRLARLELSSPPLRESALLLFWMFCGGMAILTLTPYWFDWLALIRGLRPIHPPFFTLGRIELDGGFHDFGSQNSFLRVWALYILLGNIVMFMPFGFFTALLWRGFTWRWALVLGAAITLFVECWQLVVGRAFDVSDIILNTLGVLCGYWVWRMADRLFPRFAEKLTVSPLISSD